MLLVQSGPAAPPLQRLLAASRYRIGDLLDALVAAGPRAVHDRARSGADAALRQSGGPRRPLPILADVGWAPAIPIERTLGDLLEQCRREPASR